jgi:hypothetical protein
MRSGVVGIAVLGLLLGTASAKEGWRTLTGKSCPPFQVESWLNTDGASPQPRDLRGRVWMLQILSVG